MKYLIQPEKTSPGVLFFLPLIYVAWSDSILTPTEIQIIKQKIAEQDWLSSEEKQLVHSLINPQQPPSIADLRQWKKLLKDINGHLPPHSQQTLADLGLQLARVGLTDHNQSYKNESAVKALREIELNLGILSKEAAKQMIAQKRDSLAVPLPQEPTSSFEIRKMQNLLSGDNQGLRKKIKTLLSDPVFGYDQVSPVKEVFRETVLRWCKILANQGWGSLAYPEYAGGADSMEQYIVVFEELGYHNASLAIKFGVQFGLFGGSIQGLGTEYHHRTYLPKAGSLELPGCFAMTEAGHGSNVKDLETTAIFDPKTDEFIIQTPHHHAHKEYIGNAAVHGQLATVFAQLITQDENYGVHAFLVPIRDEEGNILPGVRIEDSGEKLGLNGVDNGRIWFDQVRVPRRNLLNRFADVSESGEYSSPINSDGRRFFTMLGTLVGGRVCVPMAGLSSAKVALTIAIKYASQRRQFGPEGEPEVPILNYRSHQKRLMPLLANAYALHFAHKYMAKRFLNRTEDDAREIEALAAGLKAVSTWNTTATIQECREACGGNGYLAVNRFADLKADTEIYTTFEGDNTVLMQLVAKGRLSEFRQEFSSMNFFSMIYYLASQATKMLTEQNPIVIRNTNPEHLRDTEWHLNMFRNREQDMVVSVAQRLKKRIDKGMDSYSAFIEVQNHLINMAHAYIDRIILEQFVKAIGECSQESLKPALERLCHLYALVNIEDNFGWFLENDYLAGSKSKAIRKEVEKLCLEVRQEAVALVDAFGIPDQILGAPIALNLG
ncbi:MAG: acyl-CoA dehydrogenase [Bacteroidia bacterium]